MSVNIIFAILPTIITLAMFVLSLRNHFKLVVLDRAIHGHISTCVEIVTKRRSAR